MEMSNNFNKRNMYPKKYNNFQQDKIRLTRGGVNIEVRGDNAKIIVGAIAFAFICIGISAFSKA
jgi:hypothetical protein